MDSFVPALIAVLLAATTDRPAWLAAILGERYARPGSVIAGVAAAQMLVIGIGAAAALAIGTMMSPDARALLAGVALIAAAAGAAMPPRAPADRLDGWRIGPLATSFAGIFILAFGERAQFVAFGIAAWGSSPILAGLGAAIGAIVPGIAAATMGERAWRRLPLRAAGLAAAAMLGLAGLSLALGALRLI